MLFLQTKKSRLIVSTIALILLVGGGLIYWKTAQGVNRTWDCGGGDSSWDNDLNWSGDTEPGASDVAIFDTTCTNNVTIDKSISVAGISINAGYSGTITQSSTYTVTVGSSHFVQAAGTFTGGSGTIDINGTFTLSGGTFTSTAGTLEVGRGAGSETIFIVSGGTFNHNNGTLRFSPSGTSGGRTFTVDVDTTLTLNSVQTDASSGDYLTTASGDLIIATGTFTHMTGRVEGTWEARDNIIISSTAEGGGGTITMTGTGSKTYTYTAGGVGSLLRLNNAALSVTPSAGTTALTVSQFSLLAGTFIAPTGVLQVGRNIDAETTFSVTNGATFNHNNGTVKFIPDGYSGFQTFTIDVDTTLTFFDVEVNLGEGDSITTAAGDTIIAGGNFTHTNAKINGTWEAQGNVIIASTADGGTATLSFTGGNNQTYTDSGGNEPDGDVTINKSGGTVMLASNADWNAGSQDLTITAGTLSSATYNISTTNFTVNGGTFIGGSGTVTTAGPMVVSSGIFTGGSGNIDINNTFTLSGGTFTAPSGTLEVGYGSGGTFFTVSGGTFNHNNGTVQLRPNGLDGGATTYTVDVSTSLALYNVVLNLSGNLTNKIVTTAAGDTIIAGGNFTHTNAKLNGIWEIKGNATIASTADGGTATLSFTGPNDQTFTDQGGNEPDGNITINKPVGTVLNLASDAQWNAASQTTTITSGILNLGAYNLYTGGTLTIGANGVLHDYSTGDLILGGTVSNSGVIRLESSGSCGSTDAISITSSVGATQRSWSGSGVFTLWDVSIQDQGGTAKIQVNSGTSVSGNGTNFVFNSACNFTNNTSSLTSGLVGYWPMEENTGTTTADMSGNGNNGTLTNGPTWTTGQIGNAINFDGTDDRVNITSPTGLSSGSGAPWSLAAWAKVTTLN